MEPEDALNYYFSDVKDANSNDELEFEEEQAPNEVEQARDFLQNIGLSDLAKLYNQGKEITEKNIYDVVKEKYLTERQTQTIQSRVRTLNRTLHKKQSRRKRRQDIRDVAWNTANNEARSRSATPDSPESEESSSDDDQLPSLPQISTNDTCDAIIGPRIKWTYNDPLPNKKSHLDKGDVAHSGSDNVVLKGYQPLSEYSTTIEERLNGINHINSSNQVSKNVQKNVITNNIKKLVLNKDVEQVVSFEGLIKDNTNSGEAIIKNCDTEACMENGVNVDEFTDSQYQYLKPLLYVELVAIFDQYRIKFFKKKSYNKCKGSNVFGVNLSTLVMRDMQKPTDNFMVPYIFRCIFKELEGRICEDGILRIAGQKQKLEFLCNEIEMNFFTNRQAVEDLLKKATVHELTGVLKKLLRDLPEPIFTMELFDMFYKTNMIPNNEDKLKALNLLVLLLPIEHRNTFKLLLQFLLNIVEHETENRMNLHNVAMITAPSLFPARLLIPRDKDTKMNVKNLSKEELSQHINGAAICCLSMETILRAGFDLWIIPSYLVQQAREAEKRAQIRKIASKQKPKRIISGNTQMMGTNRSGNDPMDAISS